MGVNRSALVYVGILFLSAAVFAEEQDYIDPTRPFYESTKGQIGKSKEPTLNLQGIYYRNGVMEAVINDVLLREGEKIYGFSIKRISFDSVYYTGNSSGVLTLRQKVLKQTKAGR